MVFKPLNDQESQTHHDTLRVLSQLRLASSLPLDLTLKHRQPCPACCLLWYSCLSGLDHRPVLKISHASVFVPGRLFLSPCLEVAISQELCSLPLRKVETEKRSRQLENDLGMQHDVSAHFLVNISVAFHDPLGRSVLEYSGFLRPRRDVSELEPVLTGGLACVGDGRVGCWTQVV